MRERLWLLRHTFHGQIMVRFTTVQVPVPGLTARDGRTRRMVRRTYACPCGAERRCG